MNNGPDVFPGIYELSYTLFMFSDLYYDLRLN